MKKEITLSILIGFGLGLIITGAIYLTKKSSEINFQTPQVTTIETSNINTPSNIHSVSLIGPLDQSIIKENKTTVSGVTSPLSIVLIIGEKGEKLIKSDNKGGFETEILLDTGENQIEIQSFSETGEKATKIITVVYTTSEI